MSETVSIIIDYISWGEVKPNPNYLLITPIIYEDGIHRFTRIVERLTYPTVNGEVIVPVRDENMFEKWTGASKTNGKYVLDEFMSKCKCPIEFTETIAWK